MRYFDVFIGTPREYNDIDHVCDVIGIKGTGFDDLGKLYVSQSNSNCKFVSSEDISLVQSFYRVYDAMYYFRQEYVESEQ